MKMRVTVSLLAASVVAGFAYDALVSRSERATFCAAPLFSAASAKAAPAKVPPAKPAPKTPAKPAPKAQRKLVAFYFHGNYRCASCQRIEALSAETVKANFAKEIQAGRLEWRVVNVETRGNEHYMKDYKLFTKSVVLSDTRNGKETRWKNLDKVWTLLHDEAAFKTYVRDEVAAYLKGA